MYKKLAAVRVQNLEEALKYAYAFMKSNTLADKECNFVGPFPSFPRDSYIMPTDIFVASYNEDTLPDWDSFRQNPTHTSAFAVMCAASLNTDERQPVNFSCVKGDIAFICYGDYADAAMEAWQDILNVIQAFLRQKK